MKSDGKLERALIARIQKGDSIASIRKWFLQELGETDFMRGDLTPFEEAFFNQTVEAYMAWQRQQEERARDPSKLN
jgi:hypothetical protein